MGQTSDHLAWDPDGCTKLDSYLRLWLGPPFGCHWTCEIFGLGHLLQQFRYMSVSLGLPRDVCVQEALNI